MENTKDLRLLLASRHPLLFIGARDEERLMAILREAAERLQLPLWRWSVTHGLVRDGGDPAYNTSQLPRALDYIVSLGTPGIFVLADAHIPLGFGNGRGVLSPDGVVAARHLKELAQAPLPGRTLVITAPPHTELPQELSAETLRWELKPPSPEELESLVHRIAGDLSARGFPVHIDDDGIRSLVEAARGLSLKEAERIIRQAAMEDGVLEGDDATAVRQAKAELLGSGGILELVGTDVGSLESVGGMENLKDWLRLRARALEPEAREFGLDQPRGVLLTGIPGCGKSLVAKTLAREWKMPLVLLDPGRLYDKFVGESEARLRQSLETVDAMAPVVLWLDEIEKGFATGAEDSGVSSRILGTFLRWLQDRPPGVFLVATSNKVHSLPPEFLRKGRFDEIFFVDLPGPEQREAIFRIHLARRKRDPDAFDLPSLAEASEGFSGSEIEAAIVSAMYRAYSAERELTTADLVDELRSTVPLSRTRAEEIADIRAWAGRRAVPA